MKLTKKQIDSIKARASRATPGPWTYTGAEIESQWNYYIARKVLASEHDAPFIAKSRTDIPLLIETIEEQQEQLKTIYDSISGCYGVNKEQNQKIAEIAKQIREMLMK